MNKGLVHIYCGDGKGKTTAAFGLAFRCAGRGKKVLIAQFLKSHISGEVMAAERFDEIIVLRSNPTGKFFKDMNSEEIEITRKASGDMLEKAFLMCGKGNVDMLVLDEIAACVNYGIIDRNVLLEFIRTKPVEMEVVMTGRNPDSRLIEIADYVSCVEKIKHPFDKGITARDGIER